MHRRLWRLRRIKMDDFVIKQRVNYWWEWTLVRMGKPLIKRLIHTPVTPNMITACNLFAVLPLVCGASLKQHYILTAFLVQRYMFLDILDGNLARNKNMSSEFGRKLDIAADTIFYTFGLGIIGIGMKAPLSLIILAVLAQQIYGLTATYYILPHMRACENFQHTPLKKSFEKRNIIFGMDASLECFLISVFLLFPFRAFVFVICPILWLADLLYRLYELKLLNRR